MTAREGSHDARLERVTSGLPADVHDPKLLAAYTGGVGADVGARSTMPIKPKAKATKKR